MYSEYGSPHSSVFWHAVWQSAGRPTDGKLYNIMKRTRSRYHTAIRKVRRAAEQIKAQKLLDAPVSGGSNLMNELKKARGGKHTPDLSENVAGANGKRRSVKNSGVFTMNYIIQLEVGMK